MQDSTHREQSMAAGRYPLWVRLTYGASLIAAIYGGFMLPGIVFAHCASEAQWRMHLSQWFSVQLFVLTFPFTFFVVATLVLLISNVGYYIHRSQLLTFWAVLFAAAVPLAIFACVVPLVQNSCL